MKEVIVSKLEAEKLNRKKADKIKKKIRDAEKLLEILMKENIEMENGYW